MIRESLKYYLEECILPQYEHFDTAHRKDHAEAVIRQALLLYQNAPENIRRELNPEILYTAAACHDLGLVCGRENHHLDSGRIIRADRRLSEWFSENEIESIAQAAEDHRASGKSAPRSLYGQIVAEADRLIDGPTIIRRTIQFGQKHCPELKRAEQIARAVRHIEEKYGAGGYLRLWIPWSDNAARLEAFRTLVSDTACLTGEIERVFDELNEL